MLGRKAQQLFGLTAHECELHGWQPNRPDRGLNVVENFGSRSILRGGAWFWYFRGARRSRWRLNVQRQRKLGGLLDLGEVLDAKERFLCAFVIPASNRQNRDPESALFIGLWFDQNIHLRYAGLQNFHHPVEHPSRKQSV